MAYVRKSRKTYLRQFPLLVIVWFSILLFFSASRKELPECRANWFNVTISGEVSIQPTGTRISNIPVEAVFFWNRICLGCTSYTVAKGVTDSNGKSRFDVTIDSSFFKEYPLNVSIARDSNYIIAPNSGGTHFAEFRMYDLHLLALQNLQFEYYRQTKPAIHFRRTLSDNFDNFQAIFYHTCNLSSGSLLIQGSTNAKDTTVVITTASDVFTKVNRYKKAGGIQTTNSTDSAFCTAAGPDVINIDY